jgi:signal transduction histidine kinase
LENASLYRKEQEAVAHRDEFLSVASHELRTPLAPLKIGLQSSLAKLQNEPAKAPSPAVLKSLQVAERQVDRLQLLVDTLLDVSRIRAGRLELERGRVELHALVHDVVTRFLPELERKRVSVVERLQPVAGTWDKSRLDQVVSNLITNAIKYGEGRPIEVELRVSGPRASASRRPTPSASSTASSAPAPHRASAVWGSASTSPARSCAPMAATCAWRRCSAEARASTWSCPSKGEGPPSRGDASS